MGEEEDRASERPTERDAEPSGEPGKEEDRSADGGNSAKPSAEQPEKPTAEPPKRNDAARKSPRPKRPETRARRAQVEVTRKRAAEAGSRYEKLSDAFSRDQSQENERALMEARRVLDRAELDLEIVEAQDEAPLRKLDLVALRQLEAVARLRTSMRAMAFSLQISLSTLQSWFDAHPRLQAHVRALNRGTKDALYRAELHAALEGDAKARRFLLRATDEDFRGVSRRGSGVGPAGSEEEDGGESAPDWRYI